jgi:2-phosphoglycerate kinase
VGTDLIREVLRSNLDHTNNHNIISQSSFLAATKLASTNASVADGIKRQCEIMWPALKSAIDRERERRMPVIFEGVSLLASIVYGDSGYVPTKGLKILFVNLYIKDERTHLQRILKRGFGGMPRAAEENKL